jgi:creatinine amidohydrolase
MTGDHGAIFETSILSQLHPELVHLEELPDQITNPANDPEGDSWGAHRRDPKNVLFGILGDDPRDYEERRAKQLFDAILEWVVDRVDR